MDKPNKTLESATTAVETAALSMGEKVSDAGRSVARGARKVQKAIVVAKDAVVDKVEHPSRTLQEVKNWGAEKALAAGHLIEKTQESLEKQTFEPAVLQAALADTAAQPDENAPVHMEELVDAKP